MERPILNERSIELLRQPTRIEDLMKTIWNEKDGLTKEQTGNRGKPQDVPR